MSRFHVTDAFFCEMLLHGTVCYGSASVIAIVSISNAQSQENEQEERRACVSLLMLLPAW